MSSINRFPYVNVTGIAVAVIVMASASVYAVSAPDALPGDPCTARPSTRPAWVVTPLMKMMSDPGIAVCLAELRGPWPATPTRLR